MRSWSIRLRTLSFVFLTSLLLCAVTAFTLPLLLLHHPLHHRTFSITQLKNDVTGRESDATDNTEETERDSNSRLGSVFSKVENLAQKGRSDVKSVASATGSGVLSVAGAASTRLSTLAKKGTTDVKSVATSATFGLVGLAEKGTGNVKSAASAATLGLSGLARKGTSNVKSIANVASSSLIGLFERGTSDASNVLEWLSSQAKDGAVSAANTRAKALVLRFTGKQEYQFGDIAKELVRRVSSSNYNVQDVMLLLKVLITVGASVGPLAKILPVTLLLEMLNVSLEARLGGKILEVLAGSLDERVTAAFSAEELGDLAKRSITGAIVDFTGRETYETGDIKRAVKEDEEKNEETLGSSLPKTLELPIGKEFEAWDNLFRESHPDVELVVTASLEEGGQTSPMSQKALDLEIVNELDEWDKMFREKYPDIEM